MTCTQLLDSSYEDVGIFGESSPNGTAIHSGKPTCMAIKAEGHSRHQTLDAGLHKGVGSVFPPVNKPASEVVF